MARPCVVVLFAALCIAARAGDACRHCGREVGAHPSWDHGRVMGLLAAHEAVCPERSSPGEVYADDVDILDQAAQAQWNEAARKLREVIEVGESLTGQARALFESLSSEERASLETALAAALDHARQAVTRNREREAQLRALEAEVAGLRYEIVASEGRNWQLLRKLEETGKTVAGLQQELGRAESEAVESREGLAYVERAAGRQSERLAASRAAYWESVGGLFRGRDLGMPRDYTPEVRPREARTQRGTVSSIPEVRVQPPITAPVAATSMAPAVAAVWSGAFAMPVVADAPPVQAAGTADELKNRIRAWEGEVRHGADLDRKTETLLIETRMANDRLKESLAAAAQKERRAGILEDEREALSVKLQWALWETDVNTRGARERIAKTFHEWRQEQAWDLSKKLWQEMLRSESLGNSAYAQLRLAYDLVEGDLPKVAPAIRDSDRPEVQDLVRRLQNLDQTRGKDFLQNLFDIEEHPLPGQKWIGKLLGHELEDGE